MAKGLFITGTGTDVGKTYVTGLIVKRLQEISGSAAYYKAAMSGNDRDDQGNLIPGDAVSVINASGIDQDPNETCPYVYETAVSPHLASRMEGNPVVMSRVIAGFKSLAARYDYVTVEGSGGILCPIRFDDHRVFLEDIINAMKLPCLMIADAGLGTINSVVLTYEYMKQKGLECRGIVFNNCHPGDSCETDNRVMCEFLTGLPVIAQVCPGDRDISIPDDVLLSLYAEVEV